MQSESLSSPAATATERVSRKFVMASRAPLFIAYIMLVEVLAAAAPTTARSLTGITGAKEPTDRMLMGLKPVRPSDGGKPTLTPCVKSTLPEFSAMVPLDNITKLYFHYSVKGSKIRAAIEAQASGGASRGWLSVGFSKAGRMMGSDAVIGNLPKPIRVGAFALTGLSGFCGACNQFRD
eukprot:TRINITY_DN66174_c0_g1_i3.p1 TRINITY_DN66174_c0_g1~~TRINITY_DN66174_c0_g1_i3.p1  ORF type:complete len:179 (+),score=13.11 TRINITY_DN66174_c0_g1_i3:123-659(+)